METIADCKLVESETGMVKVICNRCDKVILETHSRAGAFWSVPGVAEHLAQCDGK